MTIFLILPTVYLLHCFGVIHLSSHSTHLIKDKEHYSPSLKIRQELDGFKTQKVLVPPETQNVPKYKDLPPPPKPDYDQCKVVKDKEKLDCFPESSANKEQCEERGCCWIPRKFKNKKKNVTRSSTTLDVPYCFYSESYQSYKYVNVTDTAFGQIAYLKRTFRSPYPNDIETIKMIVKYESENRLHIKVNRQKERHACTN